MKCSKCGKEMRKGYLFSSKDGAFSFANEVPGVSKTQKRRWFCRDNKTQAGSQDKSGSKLLPRM